MVRQSTSTARNATLGIAAAAMLAATSIAAPTRAAEPNKATVPMATPAPVTPLREIPKKHCNYLFDRVDVEIDARGDKALSSTTMRSLAAFYAFDKKGLPTCTGPREIAWERESDFVFLIKLGDSATGAFKQAADFRKDYGFIPARRPVMVGPAAELRDAAKPAL